MYCISYSSRTSMTCLVCIQYDLYNTKYEVVLASTYSTPTISYYYACSSSTIHTTKESSSLTHVVHTCYPRSVLSWVRDYSPEKGDSSSRIRDIERNVPNQ